MLRHSTILTAFLLVGACDATVDTVTDSSRDVSFPGDQTISMKQVEPRTRQQQFLFGISDIDLPRVGYMTPDGVVYLIPLIRLDSRKACNPHRVTNQPYGLACPWDWHVIPKNDRALEVGENGWKISWASDWSDYGEPFRSSSDDERNAAFAFPEPGTDWLITDEKDTVTVHVLTEDQQGEPCLLDPRNASFSDYSQTATIGACRPAVDAAMISSGTKLQPGTSGRVLFDHGAPPWQTTGNNIRYYHPIEPDIERVVLKIHGRLIDASTHEVIHDRNQGIFLATATVHGQWFLGRADIEGQDGRFLGSGDAAGYAGWKPSELQFELAFYPHPAVCSPPPPDGWSICTPPIFPSYKASHLQISVPVDYTEQPPTASLEVDWYLVPAK